MKPTLDLRVGTWPLSDSSARAFEVFVIVSQSASPGF